jgi:hypothetical protein
MHWERVRHGWPSAWQGAVAMSDGIVNVNPEQLEALMDELYAVMLRYREMEPGEGSRQVLVNLFSMPADPEDIP